MKVFIGWSKERSKSYAEALREWLPLMIQAVEPFFSHEDIPSGSRWNDRIAQELEDTDFGIFCVTPDTQGEPWINFEAGALSKKKADGRVCCVLFDFPPREPLREGPLSQFQAKRETKDDMKKLVSDINMAGKEGGILTEKMLDTVFEKWWPNLEAAIGKVKKNTPAPATTPIDVKEMVGEVLEIVREIRSGARSTGSISQSRSDADRLLRSVAKEAAAQMIAEKALRRKWLTIPEDGLLEPLFPELAMDTKKEPVPPEPAEEPGKEPEKK